MGEWVDGKKMEAQVLSLLGLWGGNVVVVGE